MSLADQKIIATTAHNAPTKVADLTGGASGAFCADAAEGDDVGACRCHDHRDDGEAPGVVVIAAPQ